MSSVCIPYRTNIHGSAILGFANLFWFNQFISRPTDISGNCLCLVLSDVTGLIDVSARHPKSSSKSMQKNVLVTTVTSKEDKKGGVRHVSQQE